MKLQARVQSFVAIIGVFVLWPQAAEAHLTSSGMGPFYDGVEHFLVSPDDLLGVVAFALLAGLYGKQHGRHLLFALPASWIVGGVLGFLTAGEKLAPVPSALSVIAAGALLAFFLRLNVARFSIAAVMFGLFHGFLNGTAAGTEGAGSITITGITLTVFLLVALLSSLTVSLKTRWMTIAVRVAGSWIAAIGLLMLGWAIRG